MKSSAPEGFPVPIDGLLASMSELLRQRHSAREVALLAEADVVAEETSFDNWNGGTTGWSIIISVEPASFARLSESERANVEEVFKETANPFFKNRSNDFLKGVFIEPKVIGSNHWRAQAKASLGTTRLPEVSPITRKHLLDELQLGDVRFNGALTEIEFLARLFDLGELPSNDSRCDNMREDVVQHRINWDDWNGPSWVWSDSRLNLRHGPNELFLSFLAELIHPLVRPITEEVERLIEIFNRHLAVDGVQIVETGTTHNRPTYGPRPLASGSLTKKRREAVVSLGNYVSRQVERLHSIELDPDLVIGTAKELAETVCRTIIRAKGEAYDPDEKLPRLAKHALNLVELLPPHWSDNQRALDAVKTLGSILGQLPHRLAELRNLSGSGHGREADFQGLGAVYARLAADTAITFASFMVSVARIDMEPAAFEEKGDTT